MMSAAVLWLLRLGGPRRRGRALGHIGLANYGGLASGPLLADAVGGGGWVLACAAALPLLGAALIAGLPRPTAQALPVRARTRMTSYAPRCDPAPA